MAEPFVFTTWREDRSFQTVVKLSRGAESVQCVVTDEVLVSTDQGFVMGMLLEMLADLWYTRYGRRLVVEAPNSAGYPWHITMQDEEEDVLEGEVIEERSAIDAPRKAIEGRRY